MKSKFILGFSFCMISVASCKKIVEIDFPIDTITTEQVFTDSINTSSAVLGMYSTLANTGMQHKIGSGQATVLGGLSADEIKAFFPGGIVPIYDNNIFPNDQDVALLWKECYANIYRFNACIEGILNGSYQGSMKQVFLSEAYFLRAFCYFYLVNYFGDVPLVVSTDWKNEAIKPRSDLGLVYAQIVDDLSFAAQHGAANYTFADGHRIRATKWAAIALLSRVRLYQKEWTKVNELASLVIDNTELFENQKYLDKVFEPDNKEIILGFRPNSIIEPYNVTIDGSFFLMPQGSSPIYYMNEELYQSFNHSDKRRVQWSDSLVYSGVRYILMKKYRYGMADRQPGGEVKEYQVCLRLAEQYLNRAEARIQMGDLVGAQTDINIIRSRAGLSDVHLTSKEEGELYLIEERRHELCFEWGHRWFDLRRWGKAEEILKPIKPLWSTKSLLFPIPLSERQSNVGLTQNPGYN